MTEILIKRLSKDVSLPKYETVGSSGVDLAANVSESIEIKPGQTEIIPTGIAVSIPKNFEIQIRPRSGLAAKNQISVLNTPGTIDADYRGEIGVILYNSSKKSYEIKPSERIAQLVFARIVKVNFENSSVLDETERSSSGFGSTGTNWYIEKFEFLKIDKNNFTFFIILFLQFNFFTILKN